MSRARRPAVPLLLLPLALAGCMKESPAKVEPPPAVLRVLAEAVQRRAALEALVVKSAEWKENAAKFDKLLELEGANRAIPPEPLDPAPMEAQLRDAARRVKLAVRSVTHEAPVPQRSFPATAPADARFELTVADVVSTWTFTLAVTPDDARRLEALRILLRAGDRLWRVTASRKEGDSQVLELKTFGQRPVTMPRYLQNSDDVHAALAAAGAPTIDTLLATHKDLAADLQGEFDRIAAARANLEPLLPDLAAQHLREVRYSVFRGFVRQRDTEPSLFPAR